MKLRFVKLDFIPIVNDFKEFTLAKFISERYYLHFGISALICAFAFYPLAVGFFVTVLAVFRVQNSLKFNPCLLIPSPLTK